VYLYQPLMAFENHKDVISRNAFEKHTMKNAWRAPLTMISVLLVDDHSMVRDGFRQLLESGGAIDVCGEADCGETGFGEYFRLKPDLMILDLNLPGESGLATLRRVISRDPLAKVLALSMYDEPSIVLRALDCGARGYLSKSASHTELLDAVSAVSQGRPYLEPRLQEMMMDRTMSERNPVQALTAREFEVFTMLAVGKSVQDISGLLHLSSKTVGAHHTSIMKKLELKNSAQLARLALIWGLVRL